MTYQAIRENTQPRINVGRTDFARKNAMHNATSQNRSAGNADISRRSSDVRTQYNKEFADRARTADARRDAERRARAERESAYRLETLEREYIMRERAEARRRARAEAYARQVREEHKEARRAIRHAERLERRREELALKRREIKIKRTKLPMNIILSILTVAALLSGVAYSANRVASSSAELSEMKSELEEIDGQIERYKLKLEDKNDLVEIEQLAVNELNMVKEGSVEKKYVTVSEGDRIVLENNESDMPESFGGILSGLSAAFDDILDYIR